MPSNEVVDRLSAVLDFPKPFFYEEMHDVVPTDAASFRALSRMTASQRHAALASGTLCVELNSWIEERFELPDVDIPDLNSGIVDAEGAAAAVRARWGLGDSPIGNMLHLAEAHGVRVYSLADECREVDAFSFWHDGIPFACIGTHKTPERAVFDLAHEVGHLVLHRDHSAPRGRREERDADAFASNLLMPKSDIEAVAPRFPSFRDLVQAKRRWRVSAAALNYRLHDLGILSDWHYRMLCIEISRQGRDRELESIPREQSQILAKVLSSLRADGVARADIAAQLRLRQSDLDSLMRGLVVSVIEGERQSSDRPRASLRLV